MMTLPDRMDWAYEHLCPVDPQYRIVWEDPLQPERAVRIVIPDSMWLAMAMRGGILPPLGAYAAGDFTAPPVGPMTEEQAMEYLVQKDVPERIWSDTGNAPRFLIVRREQIPADRIFRNAWRLAA